MLLTTLQSIWFSSLDLRSCYCDYWTGAVAVQSHAIWALQCTGYIRAADRKGAGRCSHAVSASGVASDPAEVAAIRDWMISANVSEPQSFFGLVSYY